MFLYHLFLLFGDAVFDFLDNGLDKAIYRLSPQVTLALSSHRNGFVRLFLLSQDQHIRYFCQFGIPYLLPYFFAPVVHFGPDIRILQRFHDLSGIGQELVADGQHLNLLGRQPYREFTRIMFQQKPINLSCVPSGARWMINGVSVPFSLVLYFKLNRGPCAKSTWLVASVNSLPIVLQICTSILGP